MAGRSASEVASAAVGCARATSILFAGSSGGMWAGRRRSAGRLYAERLARGAVGWSGVMASAVKHFTSVAIVSKFDLEHHA